MELARIESWERIAVFLIVLTVPALVTWFYIGDHSGAAVRALASIGATALAVLAVSIWNILKLPAIMEAEGEAERLKLQKKIETENEKSQKVELLASFMENAEDMKRRCASDLDITIDEANTWAQIVTDFIRQDFGNAYLTRYLSDAGAPINILTGNMSEEKRTIWGYCNRRAFRLEAFISELSSSRIRQDQYQPF